MCLFSRTIFDPGIKTYVSKPHFRFLHRSRAHPFDCCPVDHGPLTLVSEVPVLDSGNPSDWARDAHQKHGAGTPFYVARQRRTSCTSVAFLLDE
jgi:hypothetical protein